MEFKINESDKNKSGIYVIKNNIDDRIYIGSAFNLRKRFHIHKCNLIKGKHHSLKLMRFYNKYGKNSLSFNLLELVENKDDLIKIEQYYLDLYLPFKDKGFNSNLIANSSIGVKRSEEIKQKLRNHRAGNYLGKENPNYGNKGALNPLFGVKKSDDHRKKIGISQTGPLNHRFGKLPKSSRLVINIITGEKYLSAKCAAKANNLVYQTFIDRLSGKSKTKTNFIYA